MSAPRYNTRITRPIREQRPEWGGMYATHPAGTPIRVLRMFDDGQHVTASFVLDDGNRMGTECMTVAASALDPASHAEHGGDICRWGEAGTCVTCHVGDTTCDACGGRGYHHSGCPLGDGEDEEEE